MRRDRAQPIDAPRPRGNGQAVDGYLGADLRNVDEDYAALARFGAFGNRRERRGRSDFAIAALTQLPYPLRRRLANRAVSWLEARVGAEAAAPPRLRQQVDVDAPGEDPCSRAGVRAGQAEARTHHSDSIRRQETGGKIRCTAFDTRNDSDATVFFSWPAAPVGWRLDPPSIRGPTEGRMHVN